jgi:hypothetical protein
MQPRILMADDRADSLYTRKLLLTRELRDGQGHLEHAGVLDVVGREDVAVAVSGPS